MSNMTNKQTTFLNIWRWCGSNLCLNWPHLKILLGKLINGCGRLQGTTQKEILFCCCLFLRQGNLTSSFETHTPTHQVCFSSIFYIKKNCTYLTTPPHPHPPKEYCSHKWKQVWMELKKSKGKYGDTRIDGL
jgi:hypothetical protein